eukprot:TRINITY_DN8190_c0_g1_i2.p1 TRINITY_DN8190_c0_g1~~TRINITY_DN8190_c0_g1_i2.p1  ORF type:complete len:245 (-),score=49.02 TRINITY_DN8190_c0_g1_i2:23-757(-)
MAERLHPNDKRKILRSLEVYDSTGKKQSDIYRESREKLRYDVCWIWVDCEENALKERLDNRVDKMMESGLLKEIEHLHEKNQGKVDFTKGIYQSIGFKEFASYLEDRNSPLETCVESLKAHTRRYAKSQLQWINHRLLKKGVTIHKLDSTDLTKWTEKVVEPALQIVGAFVKGDTVPDTWALQSSVVQKGEWKKYECDVCNRTLNGEVEWKAHQKSKQHKSTKKRKRLAQASEPVKTQRTDDTT